MQIKLQILTPENTPIAMQRTFQFQMPEMAHPAAANDFLTGLEEYIHDMEAQAFFTKLFGYDKSIFQPSKIGYQLSRLPYDVATAANAVKEDVLAALNDNSF